MFYFISDIFSCILWGLVITILLTLMLFYIPQYLSVRYYHKPIGLLLLALGGCFFLFQSVLFVGGFKVKGYIPSTQQIEASGLPAKDIKTFTKELIQSYPMLESYIMSASESAAPDNISNTLELSSYYIGKINHAINLYIWRRAGWMAGVFFLLIMYFIRDSSMRKARSVTSSRRRIPN